MIRLGKRNWSSTSSEQGTHQPFDTFYLVIPCRPRIRAVDSQNVMSGFGFGSLRRGNRKHPARLELSILVLPRIVATGHDTSTLHGSGRAVVAGRMALMQKTRRMRRDRGCARGLNLLRAASFGAFDPEIATGSGLTHWAGMPSGFGSARPPFAGRNLSPKLHAVVIPVSRRSCFSVGRILAGNASVE